MSKKEVKTNAMRMLDRAKVSYTYEEYECDDFTDGIQTADKLGYDHKLVYKTLVTTGKTGNHYVFVIPIEAEIDFKKAAKVVGEKSLEILHLKDLTKVTGYVRGGCTAIGSRKVAKAEPKRLAATARPMPEARSFLRDLIEQRRDPRQNYDRQHRQAHVVQALEHALRRLQRDHVEAQRRGHQVAQPLGDRPDGRGDHAQRRRDHRQMAEIARARNLAFLARLLQPLGCGG